MGGNALSFETRRVSATEYKDLSGKIVCIAQSVFPGADIRIVQSYRNKPDHGDIDVLISTGVNDSRRSEIIQSAFAPKEIFANSNCYSFDYDDVQIDFIFLPPDDMDIASAYFAYNDLGNLVGRVYHKMGLKFGHDGLWLTVMADTRVIGEICLSKDIKEILEFGAYDYETWKSGFDNLDDIFEFVVSSKFYSYDIFDLDNRNSKARMRDRKRKTYTAFLKFAEDLKAIDGESDYRWMPSSSYLADVLVQFDILDDYVQIIRDYSESRYVRSIFNGKIVMEVVPSLQGRDLSKFMSDFVNNVVPKDRMKDYSPDQMKNVIQNYAIVQGYL